MKYHIMIIMGIGMLANQAQAGYMDPVVDLKDWRWVGSVSVGPVWENAGQTQTFYLTPAIEKTYAASRDTQVLADGEIFVGIQKELPHALQGQLGLEVALTDNAQLSGNIWDDANPSFNNYTYNYQIQHTHIAVRGTLLADLGYWAIPWVSASLGLGFNDAHSFYNTPLIPEALSMPNFSSHTQASFTYTVGVGLQKTLSPHCQVGISYQFADWGASHLNRASNQTLNSGLSLNHLYTNGLLFNLTYLQ